LTASKEKTIKIGFFTYRVFFQPADGEDHGSTDTDNKMIFIDSGRNIQCKRETLFHEIHHACLDDCPSFKMVYDTPDEREEDVIRFLSPRMIQVLNDNKWVREYLFGE
jgi:Zn-dependent peptidase ImmA (M78 family)